MKRVSTVLATSLLCSSAAALADSRTIVDHLSDCAVKLHRVSSASPTDYPIEFLAQEFFYILDRRAPSLYLFTPYTAGKFDLSPVIRRAVGAELDKSAQQVKDQSFPFTACCQNRLPYNIAIPYVPSDSTRPKGYFYINLTDASPGIYDEVHWAREENRMRINRHDEPISKSSLHDVRRAGIDRFLSGPLQAMPDFTHDRPSEVNNGVTMTSVTDQPDKGVVYQPLVLEDQLWEKSARDSVSPDAVTILLAHVKYVQSVLPQLHNVGQRADCWGHLGCDYTYSKDDVARERALQDDAAAACMFAAKESRADAVAPVIPPRSSDENGAAMSAAEFRELRQSAQAGDPAAQFAVGDIYAEGEDQPQNDAEAVKWFRRAADQGNARAQSNLGLMYDNGRGVSADHAAALKWYRKAAAQGDETARNLLELSTPDSCHRDDQCTLVYRCGDAAINKNYLAQFQASACSLSSKHSPNATARCLNGQCRAIELSCRDDAQCAVAWDGCENVAVKADGGSSMQPAVRSCSSPIAHDTNVAHCSNGHCTLIKQAARPLEK